MNEQQEINIKPGLIFERICAIKGTVDAVGKSRKASNGSFSYKYRGLEDLINALSPLFATHQVFPIPTVLDTVRNHVETEKGKDKFITLLKVAYRFYAVDSSYVECIVLGEGIDNGDKSSSKAMSEAFKKALEQIFCIPTGEAGEGDVLPQQQPQNQSYGQPRKSLPPNFNPVAVNVEDQATPRQLGAIQNSAKRAGRNAEKVCQENFECSLSELSRKGASWMIDHFNDLAKNN